MRVTRGLRGYRPSSYPVLTIGNFDGHHLGHRALLAAVVSAARRNAGEACVLTFDPHPVWVLAPQAELLLLTDQEEKIARFEAAGVDQVLVLPFDQRLASMTPETFVTEVLRDAIRAREVFVGEHFAFGKGRSGRVADLVRLGHEAGFDVHPLAPVQVGGEVVSSSRIRKLLLTGRVQEASACLGRLYGLRGRVVPGKQRGHGLGCPTANLPLPRGRVVPADGIYAAVATWKESRFEAVAYIGTRPTFENGERVLEVSLLDQRQDLYGEELLVQFVERVREDRRFATPEELAAEIERDVAKTRAILTRVGKELLS